MTVPAEPSEAPNEPRAKPRVSSLRTARAVLFAVLVAIPVLLRMFFFEGFMSSSESMAPTLFGSEHFVVHRRAYGFGAHRAPERGDVIVFPSPEHPEKDYVNRVIGLPGDTIQIQQGIVLINGWRLPSCVAGLAKLALDDKERLGVVMVELLGDTAYLVFHEDKEHHHGEELSEPDDNHNAGPYTVPNNEVFVLGDRRENSHDSRDWFGGPGGGVRIDSIKGRAGRIWMSTGKNGIQGSRIGTSLAAATPKCSALLPPEVCQAVEKCLGNRPPRDVTTPPAALAPPAHAPAPPP